MGFSYELIVPLPSRTGPIASIIPLVLSTGEVLLGLCLRRGHAGLCELLTSVSSQSTLLLPSSVRSRLVRLHPSPVHPTAAVLAIFLGLCFVIGLLSFSFFFFWGGGRLFVVF